MFNWYSTRTPPLEVGSYLVTTATGKVMVDRWDGNDWGQCRPRKGRYRPHKAWGHLPKPCNYGGQS